jgi:nicotinamidase/pyrazinamidase
MTTFTPIVLADNDVLVVVDLQNDFMTGSLAIPDAEAIVAPINRLGTLFQHIVLTQDWHPQGHVSFASSHCDAKIGDIVQVAYGAQKVFADHCVQQSWGAEFHAGLDLPNTELIIRKGFRRDIDSFSAFIENDKVTTTGLAHYLRGRGFERVFLCGLALYGCVRFSALDARGAGFPTFVIDDASRSRSDPRSAVMATELAAAGVQRINSTALGRAG